MYVRVCVCAHSLTRSLASVSLFVCMGMPLYLREQLSPLKYVRYKLVVCTDNNTVFLHACCRSSSREYIIITILRTCSVAVKRLYCVWWKQVEQLFPPF